MARAHDHLDTWTQIDNEYTRNISKSTRKRAIVVPAYPHHSQECGSQKGRERALGSRPCLLPHHALVCKGFNVSNRKGEEKTRGLKTIHESAPGPARRVRLYSLFIEIINRAADLLAILSPRARQARKEEGIRPPSLRILSGRQDWGTTRPADRGRCFRTRAGRRSVLNRKGEREQRNPISG